MERTIELGKYEYYEEKVAIDVDIELKDGNFSASAGIWNKQHTDYQTCGQILDEVMKVFLPLPDSSEKRLFTKIHSLWKRYHLNNLKAGTPEQEAALVSKSFFTYRSKNPNMDYYTAACAYLKLINLYTVPSEQADQYRKYDSDKGKLYTYGHGWLKFPIPEQNIKEIESLFNEGIK